MYTRILLAIALIGCAKSVNPSTHLGPGRVVVVGAELEATASWSATCTKSSLENLLDDNPDTYLCEEKRVRIEVECKGACKFGGSSRQQGGTLGKVTLIAAELGRMVVRIANTRLDTGAIDVETFGVEIVPPDALALDCEAAGGRSPCGPEGVSAKAPIVYPKVLLADRAVYSTHLRVNGKATHLDARHPAMSLAEVFPEARVDDGVLPGTYMIELTLAGLVERYQVVAR